MNSWIHLIVFPVSQRFSKKSESELKELATSAVKKQIEVRSVHKLCALPRCAC
jgi:hypothetical protein